MTRMIIRRWSPSRSRVEAISPLVVSDVPEPLTGAPTKDVLTNAGTNGAVLQDVFHSRYVAVYIYDHLELMIRPVSE